ncbi:MAG: helix-turn-helix transcriptional regulator [Leptospiraceae bacterium]|nr:helix-turn-helix transcriptional regulator [Leptospiraceae bacterium]
MLNVFYNLLADEPAPVNPLTAVLFSGGNYLILTFLIIKPAVFSVSADFAPAAQKGKYAKIQNIDAVNRKRYAQQIRDILAGSEAYLDDSYSLNDLAEQLKLSPHLVSMIINAELQQNFYNLVNSYRVEKAKQLLMSAAEPNMIEVAYASGFQSKSAFNRVFKQITGQTPSTFRVS